MRSRLRCASARGFRVGDLERCLAIMILLANGESLRLYSLTGDDLRFTYNHDNRQGCAIAFPADGNQEKNK
jgi:hypothetical protein